MTMLRSVDKLNELLAQAVVVGTVQVRTQVTLFTYFPVLLFFSVTLFPFIMSIRRSLKVYGDEGDK